MPENVVYFHGFKYVPPKGKPLDARYLVQPKPVLIEGTGDTKIDETDKIDLVELTQTYQDQCGVEFVMKQLRMGAILPESVCDDGKHSGDASLFGNDHIEAAEIAEAAGQRKAALCKELGLDPDNATEEEVKTKLEAIYKAAAQAQSEKPKEDNQ